MYSANTEMPFLSHKKLYGKLHFYYCCILSMDTGNKGVIFWLSKNKIQAN